MKKIFPMLLTLLLLLSLVGCRKSVHDCLTTKDDRLYLVLPDSKEELRVDESIKPYISYIDYDLLENAEKTILQSISQEHDGNFHLYMDKEGYLCLGLGYIVYGSGKCGDHDHKHLGERIATNSKYNLSFKLLSREDLPASITISSSPKQPTYIFSPKGIATVTDWINSLHFLYEPADVQPNGTTWVVQLEYPDGKTQTLYQCDRYIRSGSDPWYEIPYDESDDISVLVQEHGINISYSSTADLSQFPVAQPLKEYGRIMRVEADKLLIAPVGGSKYGPLVWVLYDQAEAFTSDQLVIYTFRDVQPAASSGDYLRIIADTVYE